MPSCFISHAWRNDGHQFAMKLGNALKEKNVKVWIDEEKIRPGDPLNEIIKRGIEHESDAFLFVLSLETLKSKMCKYELDFALNQMEKNYKSIIPILFKECTIPEYLRNICYADFRDPKCFNVALERLVEGIKNSAKIRKLCIELSHPDPDKRIKVSERLGNSKNPLVLGSLKNRLLSDEPNPIVKHWLALAIGEVGGMKAVKILEQAMGEIDPFAGLGVINGMIDVFESLDEKVLSQALNILSEVINSNNPVKCICAVKILVQLKRKSNRIDSILRNLINDPDVNIRGIVKKYFIKRKGGCHENARL